ncbi:hypothetical protein NK8_85220 (plasmid) [Caballeronia sp. NK8]|nr:hypothetical protein NK8_85220 [Caballeronia sp. NK8]
MSLPRLALLGLFPIVAAIGFALILPGSASNSTTLGPTQLCLIVGIVCGVAGFGAGYVARSPKAAELEHDWRRSVYNPKEFRRAK